MFYLERIEFYITNVCNYNCDNCNRLNNYNFSGHQKWEDYAEVYKAWHKRIDFGVISILGGEPLLNPSLPDWLTGLRSLWPNATIQLLTNGSRLKHTPWLYDAINKNKIELEISTHNRGTFDKTASEISEILSKPIQTNLTKNADLWVNEYNNIKDPSWPECQTHLDFESLPEWIQDECTNLHKIDPKTFFYNSGTVQLVDANQVVVSLNYYEDFVTAPLYYNNDNHFKVYNSDPEQAHKVCISKNCYTFVRGKLYKCHHVALLPEFSEQFHVDMTEQDTELLHAYQPAQSTDTDEELSMFINNLTHSIPQCKLCPDKLFPVRVLASNIKPKVLKRQKI